MNAVASSRRRGRLLYGEPLARHSSWRVGGPADRYYAPADVKDLTLFLAGLAPFEPITWLGLGSNVLIRDGGVRGTVIATESLTACELVAPGLLYVEAGVPCAKVARFAAKAGYRNAEFMAGIPGTLGGALAMNAGAFGSETWPLVQEVETVNRRGACHRRPSLDYAVGYREIQGPAEEWFTAAWLALEQDPERQGMERIRALLAKRSASQPTRIASCGSVFKNPPGDYAARLIDSAGLKGLRIGGGCVSEKHANFIVNLGDATAADLEALIEHVIAAVEAKHGVRLTPEVRLIGERIDRSLANG